MPIQINELIIRANVVEQDGANKQDVNSYSYSAQASADSFATSVYVEKRRKER